MLVAPLGPFALPPAHAQTIRLTLDPARATAATTDLRIGTDHPDQPLVTLTVLAPPRPEHP